MAQRRILSLWFPRLAADLALRRHPGLAAHPLAIIVPTGNRHVVASLSPEAADAGLRTGMALADARAICPDLATLPADPHRTARARAGLRRWAGRFSPWVGEDGDDGLVADISGSAHLFGGEAALAGRIASDCAGFGLAVRTGIADTVGAAWAVARFAAPAGTTTAAAPTRSGDDIDQEARATRARAARRRPVPAGANAGPVAGNGPAAGTAIIPAGRTRTMLGALPVAALRLPPDTVEALNRLGLRRIDDLAGIPRAAAARRFSTQAVLRLDQAFGLEPEPISPARPPHRLSVRLTLPEPIGRAEDILAGIDRLLPALCDRLALAGQGARRVRLTALRSDHGQCSIEVGLARPSSLPADIRPLLLLKIGAIDPGFGIDVLRLETIQAEPAGRPAPKPLPGQDPSAVPAGDGHDLDLLVGRLGTRIGIEAMLRLAPSDRHLPERCARLEAAALVPAMATWPVRSRPRPIRLFPPEPVTAEPVTAEPVTGEPATAMPAGLTARPPASFRWRRRAYRVALAEGPERIAPEWWLDDPAWRSGTRDYWRVETTEGLRLWLFEAQGADMAGGWFAHGDFA